MDSGNPAGDGSQPHVRSTTEWNFAFAFNDPDFSDRVLRIEIMPDLPDSKSDSDPKIAAWACNPKLRREGNDLKMKRNEHILNSIITDLIDVSAFVNPGEENAPLGIEMGSEIGDEDIQGDDSLHNDAGSGSDIVEVKTIHVSSPILAAKSPFFYKLFKEFKQRDVSLRIRVSDEGAFMELLNFMYINSLSITSHVSLVELLITADIYEVDSCLRYCCRLLLDSRMSIESALLYLDLPFRVLAVDVVGPLIGAAKQFVANSYNDLTKYEEEVLKLPIAGIEAVLASDDLQVGCEDVVFDFVLKWARLHYPKVEERKKMIETRLAKLVRFPHMSCKKLRKVMSLNEFGRDLSVKYVLEALFFKAEPMYRQRSLVSKGTSVSYKGFVERAYRYRPVQVVELELCHPHCGCVVHLDLKREECVSLFPDGRIYSQAFHLGGQGFFLSAHCNMNPQYTSYCFGLFLGMQEKGTESLSVDYEFASKSKPSQEYASKYKGTYGFTGGKAVGPKNLFEIPWNAFVAHDCPFFINGILHLRAELTIRH